MRSRWHHRNPALDPTRYQGGAPGKFDGSLSANLALLQADVEQLGAGPHRDGDRLLVGTTALNGRNDIVDRVASSAGGVATIFAGNKGGHHDP